MSYTCPTLTHRSRPVAVIAAALLAMLLSSNASADASDWLDLPHRRIVLAWTINEQWAVQLDLSFEDQAVSGNYCYTARGMPLYLEGTREVADGHGLALTEHESAHRVAAVKDAPITGRWSITPAPDGRQWSGTWTSPEGDRSYPVTLKLVAEYDLMARTVAGGTAQAESPRLIGQNAALTEEVGRLADNTIEQANGFITQVRDWYADTDSDPDLAQHFANVGGYYHSTDCRIDYLDDTLISLYVLNYEYSGGAHGNSGYSARTFELRDGKARRVALLGLFMPDSGWLEALRPLIVDKLREQDAKWLPTPEDINNDDMLSEHALSVFTIAPNGLTFYFGPYMFGPYSQGSFEITLAWDDLRQWVDAAGPAGHWLQ